MTGDYGPYVYCDRHGNFIGVPSCPMCAAEMTTITPVNSIIDRSYLNDFKFDAMLKYCTTHGSYDGRGHLTCPICFEEVKELLLKKYAEEEKLKEQIVQETKTRKYLPTLSDLIDRLTITQLKEVKIPEQKEQYAKEIEEIVHDIQMILDEGSNWENFDAKMIRDIIVLAQMNTHIWVNETNFRNGVKDGNNLELTHGLNGIRNTAKNKIQETVGGRKDYKVDNVEAFKDWVPSGYEKKK